MKFLYWNINKKPIQHLVVTLAHEHDVDMIILSECEFSLPDLLVEINTPITKKYGLPFSSVPDPVIITRLPRQSLKIIRDLPGISIRRLIPPLGPDILILTVHLRSKLHADEHDQTAFCTRLARYVEQEEQKLGHHRTLLENLL